jgi:MFS family permease
MAKSDWWVSRNVLLIALSAFFADLGYQAVIAGFPILIVVVLKAPVILFGAAMALSYGVGSLIGYAGGKLSDRHSKKKVAVLGNILIPLLSLSGIAASGAEAVALFAGGWWARNFRSPARRAMLSDLTNASERSRAFGLLNALDISGGILATFYLIAFLLLGIGLRYIFLLTVIPLLASTLCLLMVKSRNRAGSPPQPKREAAAMHNATFRWNRRIYGGVLAATALYGFSFYSFGFPILTVYQSSGSYLYGILTYTFYLAAAAAFGYIIGRRLEKRIEKAPYYLGIMGYMVSAFGSLLLSISYSAGLPLWSFYLGAVVLGLGLGAIETLEPTIVSFIKSKEIGKGMGSLTAYRSAGLFFGNLVMGILYVVNPSWSYIYAAIAAFASGLVILLPLLASEKRKL